MDCLFNENETKAMEVYIEEIRTKGYNPIIYVSPDYDFAKAGLIKINPSAVPLNSVVSVKLNIENGFTGVYYGAPIFVFDGLDSHTCCVMPQNNHIPFSV